MSEPEPTSRDRVILRYLAVASPIMPIEGFKPEVDGLVVNVGLRGNVGSLTDAQLTELAQSMGSHFTGRADFPIGLFAGLEAAVKRYVNPTSPSGRVVVDLILPRFDPYFEALACLIGKVAPVRLALGVHHLDVHSRRLERFESLFGASPRKAGAVVGDSGVLHRPTDEVIVVDGLVGDWAFRAPLLKIAADAGVPSVVVKPDDMGDGLLVTWDRGAPLETSALLAHVSAGVQPEATVERRFQGEHYLISDAETHRPTQAALDRLQAVRWNVGGTFSATSELLRAHPQGTALGACLEELVLTWLDLRIFDGSMVNEMVLHDQSHALSVDRNVAIIAGALLDDGKITVDDVFRLGCAAWLHDCGHSSARVSADGHDAVPVEPGFVRDFHGPLGAVRIEQRTAELGLASEHLGWVQLLTKHHQGWTSAGDRVDQQTPRHDSEEEAALSRALTSSLTESMVELGLAGADRDRVVQLVALLRVSDALDIGRHRVRHRDWHTKQLDEFIRIYTRRCMDAIDQGEATAKLLERLRTAQDHVSAMIDGTSEAKNEFEQVHALIKASLDALDSGLDLPARRRITRWTDRAVAYYQYLAKQGEHFDLHGSINTVIPVVGGGSGERDLHVLVVPEADKLDDGAITRVTEFLAKELGIDIDEEDFYPGLPFYAKEPIRSAFARLGMPLTEGVRLRAEVLVPDWWKRYRATGHPAELPFSYQDTVDQEAEGQGELGSA